MKKLCFAGYFRTCALIPKTLLALTSLEACSAPAPPSPPPTREIRQISEEIPSHEEIGGRAVFVGDARWTVVAVTSTPARPRTKRKFLVTADVQNLSSQPSRLLLTPMCIDDQGNTIAPVDPVETNSPVVPRSLLELDEIAPGSSRSTRWLCELPAGRRLTGLDVPGWSAIDGVARLRVVTF
jgi:hypothetical protein